jgi:type III pantothenate kinase
LIVDAGTALTVDALGSRGGEPAFLGGAIAPGPDLLSRAMGRGAAQLFEVDTRGLEPERVPALGRSTRAALESGIVHGLRGAVRELVERIGQASGLEQAPVFLCGGAAALLHDAQLFPGHALHLEPLLVHRGLLAADRSSS